MELYRFYSSSCHSPAPPPSYLAAAQSTTVCHSGTDLPRLSWKLAAATRVAAVVTAQTVGRENATHTDGSNAFVAII